MGLISAIIGAIIGGYILINEGWPLHYLINVLNINPDHYLIVMLLLIGFITGIIAGSSIWGAISGIGVIPAVLILNFLAFKREELIIDYMARRIMMIGYDRILYLGVGGFLGGIISGSLRKKDDYILVRIKK
jgi:hypothetical protein